MGYKGKITDISLLLDEDGTMEIYAKANIMIEKLYYKNNIRMRSEKKLDEYAKTILGKNITVFVEE